MTAMRVVKGRVVGNTVVMDEALPEGMAVDVVVHEAAESNDFVLTEELRKELRDASEAMKRGEAVDMDDVLAELERL
jgi:K+/H+ antiporter YhaU regulatory subunit KhtT